MNCKTMNVIDILDELSRKAQNDMELKSRLLATKESSNSVSEFCSIARELGYELYDMDLIDAGEEFHAAMKRSTNGGGENSPKLTGQDDYYEMFIAELRNVSITNQNKLAVVFPGIGYHVDKPLLFHTRKLLRELGYEVADVNYNGFPSGIKGNPQKMKGAFDRALLQSEDILKDVDLAKADDLIFVSKSIGTAVSAAYAGNHGLAPRHIYFTPIAEAFDYITPKSGIAFHGTSDPWADTGIITGKCSEYEIDLFITNGADHSLEIGNTLKDIQELYSIMDMVKRFISPEG